MAPIVTHKDRSKDLITYVCKGQISVDEILTAAQEYFSGEVTKDVLWDFAEAEVDIRQPQIDKLMIYLRGLLPEELEKRRGGRVAIVAPKEYVVGVMEQFKGWSEMVDAPFMFQMFYDAEEALAWLERSR
ncbi:MAG: hypothetical protein PVH99_08765 [Desulfobacteraceae bacterium]|jgi:hypothetical protein